MLFEIYFKCYLVNCTSVVYCKGMLNSSELANATFTTDDIDIVYRKSKEYDGVGAYQN